MAMPEPGMSHEQTDYRGEIARRNPLLDLMDSEKVYVEQLGLVIRVSISCSRHLTSAPTSQHFSCAGFA